MDPPVPATLGKYQLIRQLAVGGMAEVFLAKVAGPGGFEKTVVVKRVLPHLAEDETFVAMFRSEARLAAKLSHPNLVSIFDFGQEGDDWFLVMEFIDGLTLRGLFRRAVSSSQPLPFNVAARILTGVCEGLAYAHDFKDPKTGQALDLIHRDVNPDNILVSKNGEVKLLDFGLAKFAGQLHRSEIGKIKGKYSYMSPEQLRGEPLDRRTDIFALGIVLYETLAGVKPVLPIDAEAIARAILFEAFPKVSVHRPDVPPALQQILDRAFEKDRNRRYSNCHEVKEDLERFIESEPEPVGALQLAEWVAKLSTPTGRSGAKPRVAATPVEPPGPEPWAPPVQSPRSRAGSAEQTPTQVTDQPPAPRDEAGVRQSALERMRAWLRGK